MSEKNAFSEVSLKSVQPKKGKTMLFDSQQEKKIEILEKDLKEKKVEIEQLKQENNRLEHELGKLKRESDKLHFEREKTVVEFKRQSLVSVDQVLSRENDTLREEEQKLKLEITELKATINRLQVSLSKIAGDRMIVGNPAITDLSDSNRPQKLAEKFNALYDNDWTDAFEVVSNINDDEKIICQKLLDIFEKCWNFCCEYSDKQLKQLQLQCLYPDVKETENMEELLKGCPVQAIKIIKDTRRCFSQQFIPRIYEYYMETVMKNENSMKDSMKSFIEACIELCWLSAISDPPIHFSIKLDNMDHFRAYTQSGVDVDYIVWPAMYLHEYGPLLYKGVVQYKSSRNEA